MRHRFHVPDALKSGTTIALDAEERHHARVLRVREGEEVEVFDALGKNYLARFGSPEAITILRETENREPRTENHLAISIIQLEKFEFVLQKGTELGVRSFIPLITDRIEVRVERLRGKEDRWRKIVLEAVKQSGRSQIPAIESPARFDDAITRAGTKIVFDADTGELLGAHMIGAEVTEMIQGYVVARTLESTEKELINSVFPHPTVSETMHEAVLDAYGRAIHF